MYAIRSYYGLGDRQAFDPRHVHVIGAVLALLAVKMKAKRNSFQLKMNTNTAEAMMPCTRITSYNVCYTKLLRPR